MEDNLEKFSFTLCMKPCESCSISLKELWPAFNEYRFKCLQKYFCCICSLHILLLSWNVLKYQNSIIRLSIWYRFWCCSTNLNYSRALFYMDDFLKSMLFKVYMKFKFNAKKLKEVIYFSKDPAMNNYYDNSRCILETTLAKDVVEQSKIKTNCGSNWQRVLRSFQYQIGLFVIFLE